MSTAVRSERGRGGREGGQGLHSPFRTSIAAAHSVELEKFDAEGILAFAERVLPRASELWVQASLNQKQRLQQLFFPEGLAFDGKRFVRTAVTVPKGARCVSRRGVGAAARGVELPQLAALSP
jgi:hypothetical protein